MSDKIAVTIFTLKKQQIRVSVAPAVFIGALLARSVAHLHLPPADYVLVNRRTRLPLSADDSIEAAGLESGVELVIMPRPALTKLVELAAQKASSPAVEMPIHPAPVPAPPPLPEPSDTPPAFATPTLTAIPTPAASAFDEQPQEFVQPLLESARAPTAPHLRAVTLTPAHTHPTEPALQLASATPKPSTSRPSQPVKPAPEADSAELVEITGAFFTPSPPPDASPALHLDESTSAFYTPKLPPAEPMPSFVRQPAPAHSATPTSQPVTPVTATQVQDRTRRARLIALAGSLLIGIALVLPFGNFRFNLYFQNIFGATFTSTFYSELTLLEALGSVDYVIPPDAIFRSFDFAGIEYFVLTSAGKSDLAERGLPLAIMLYGTPTLFILILNRRWFRRYRRVLALGALGIAVGTYLLIVSDNAVNDVYAGFFVYGAGLLCWLVAGIIRAERRSGGSG